MAFLGPPFSEGLGLERLTVLTGDQASSPGSTGRSPPPDGQVGGTLFYWMTTRNSKLLPGPLKYSRRPSTEGETLRKPPINVYGGLRSRSGIITFVFTRQGTQTTGRWPGAGPVLSEPAMGADRSPPSIHLSPAPPRQEENTAPCRGGWGAR